MPISISSPEFDNGEQIPSRFTGDGDNISPRLKWSNIPKNAVSLALIMDDPDAPGDTFTHWVMFNIPAKSKGLKEAIANKTDLPGGSLQGRNSSGGVGYYGPYPPAGSRHRYYFTLYALDTKLEVKPIASKYQILKAMEGHILDSGITLGLYQRTHGFSAGR